MLALTTASLSEKLLFDEVIEALKASPLVDGIAEFGAHAAGGVNPASDYNRLVVESAYDIIFHISNG